ncbi:MAG TPA: nitronate monooxygenase [Kofleriaceae bacterium]|jgi:enoyl-[acyl-carrier protein] reductase II
MAKHSFTRRQWLGIAGGAGAALALGGGRAGADGCGPRLETRLVTEYGARYPIVNAGMSFVGLDELAIAVTNAGGIGIYGAAPEPPPVVDARLSAIDAATSGPFGIDFIIASSALGDFTTQDHIDIVAAHAVPVVAFHWAIPSTAWVDQLHAAGCRVWVQAGDVDFARQALAAGADGVIAQGRSAGGHNRNSTIPTLVLVERIRAEVSRECLLLAAGGIANGASLVRALDAGADGGWMGTRFVAATESYAHPEYKARLVAAGLLSTTFTTAFGPEWEGQQQRVLRDAAVEHPGATTPATIGTTVLFPGVVNAPYTMPNHSAIVPTRDTAGDFTQMDMPAGSESVLEIGSVRSAHQIIADVVAEALAS